MPKQPIPDQPLYFNADALAQSGAQYVCWLDVMGSRTAMAHNWRRSANFIGRLHAAVLACDRTNTRTYPVMDGVFITSTSHKDVLSLVRAIIAQLAYTFTFEKSDKHRFMVRGAIAFGSVVHGSDVNEKANEEVAASGPYRNSLLFGIPMIQAYEAEHHAPPFGIAIDISARAFAEDGHNPLSGQWLKWHNQSEYKFLPQFKTALKNYFLWCETHTYSLQYPKERLLEHKAMALEYFEDLPD